MPNNRPLAPHLQVYKLPPTGIVSIAHRITGVLLVFGLALYVVSFYCILLGEVQFLALQSFLRGVVGQVLVAGLIYALFLHLCHGIRHLLWNVGVGFGASAMDKNAAIELLASVILTAIFYAL